MNVQDALPLVAEGDVGVPARAESTPLPSTPESSAQPLSVPGLTMLAELLFLRGRGEPVASGRGGVVKKLTNEILIDVCDLWRARCRSEAELRRAQRVGSSRLHACRLARRL